MSCFNPQIIPYKGSDKAQCGLKYMSVPCGKCEGCLKDRQNDWIYRLESEMRSSSHSYFVTLTYDPKSLPFTDGISFKRYKDLVTYNDSMEFLVTSLWPKDVTNYFKRLRKSLNSPDSFKYFYCGEYGSHSSNRPHYHIAMFFTDNVSPYAIEYCIQNAWPYGWCDIKPLVPDRCAYVTKYVLKDSDLARSDQRQVDYFSHSSKGLGIDGYLKDREYYRELKSVPLSSGNFVRVPRYFRKKFTPKDDYNFLKQIQNDKRNEERSQRIIERLRQDYTIRTGCFEPESFAEFVQRSTDHETIRKLRQQLRKRKKDF